MEMGSGPADAQENNNNNNKNNSCTYNNIVGHKAKNDAFNLWDVMYYIIQCTKIRTHLASRGWTVFGVVII